MNRMKGMIDWWKSPVTRKNPNKIVISASYYVDSLVIPSLIVHIRSNPGGGAYDHERFLYECYTSQKKKNSY